jgi:hypothetical protein
VADGGGEVHHVHALHVALEHVLGPPAHQLSNRNALKRHKEPTL